MVIIGILKLLVKEYEVYYMSFIKATGIDDEKVIIRASDIKYIIGFEKYTLIDSDEYEFRVKESADEVGDRVREAINNAARLRINNV